MKVDVRGFHLICLCMLLQFGCLLQTEHAACLFWVAKLLLLKKPLEVLEHLCAGFAPLSTSILLFLRGPNEFPILSLRHPRKLFPVLLEPEYFSRYGKEASFSTTSTPLLTPRKAQPLSGSFDFLLRNLEPWKGLSGDFENTMAQLL